MFTAITIYKNIERGICRNVSSLTSLRVGCYCIQPWSPAIIQYEHLHLPGAVSQNGTAIHLRIDSCDRDLSWVCESHVCYFWAQKQKSWQPDHVAWNSIEAIKYQQHCFSDLWNIKMKYLYDNFLMYLDITNSRSVGRFVCLACFSLWLWIRLPVHIFTLLQLCGFS